MMLPIPKKLNQHQLDEIREIATFIIEQRHWDNLPWVYAWDGAFPLKPTSQEIEDEFNILKIKVSRILESNSNRYRIRQKNRTLTNAIP
jgi:hypothetical protein